MRMPRRYDARTFDHVTPAMKDSYVRDGILVLDGLIDPADCDALRKRMAEITIDLDENAQKTIFSTTSQDHAQDDYFLSSGSKTRYFFESDAFDSEGRLVDAPGKCLNKVGHAMHDLDPVFSQFSRQHKLKAVVEGLGVEDPILLQSMYIFKQPHIGGEVVCHQDATFLWTEPQTVMGLWIALEDATISNGCLWGIPGGHKGSAPKQRFKRTEDESGTEMITLDDTPFDEAGRVPLEAPKGTLLAFHGLFPHLSSANRSSASRHAYTLHVIDGTAHYPDSNWLRRPDSLPLKGF